MNKTILAVAALLLAATQVEAAPSAKVTMAAMAEWYAAHCDAKGLAGPNGAMAAAFAKTASAADMAAARQAVAAKAGTFPDVKTACGVLAKGFGQ